MPDRPGVKSRKAIEEEGMENYESEPAKFQKVSEAERSSHSYGYMTTFVKTQN